MTGVDKPKKENDHALDSLRYCLFTHFFAKPLQTMGINELERIKAEVYGGGDNMPEWTKQPGDYPQTYHPLI
jgi:hypothetical protein